MQRVHFQIRVGVFNFQDKYLFSIFDFVETGISSGLMGCLARMQTLPYIFEIDDNIAHKEKSSWTLFFIKNSFFLNKSIKISIDYVTII